MKKLFVVLVFILPALANAFSRDIYDEIVKGEPEWMKKQITADLGDFQNKVISLSEIDELIAKEPGLLLVKYTIKNNKISTTQKFPPSDRTQALKDALIELSKTVSLPDVEFVMCAHDSVSHGSDSIPIFAMSKLKDSTNVVLVPDFEALREKYQVLKKIDITKKTLDWDDKIEQLVWRGCVTQHPTTYSLDITIRPDNVHLFSRITLCRLATYYPKLIDAKFTSYMQEGKKISFLKKYGGDWMEFRDLAHYKYHILIDGTASPYSNSGWKLFINSLVFKEESSFIQWYYGAMEPYVHYMPVETNLTDLVEKLRWVKKHDGYAQAVARNMYKFARSHITYKHNLTYIYYLINAYSNLSFAE